MRRASTYHYEDESVLGIFLIQLTDVLDALIRFLASAIIPEKNDIILFGSCESKAKFVYSVLAFQGVDYTVLQLVA